ncbi:MULTISPECIES: J domain-containing protein [unclassified Arthrobacter]|uniref:J domain-containing protein n=1 Tax=unclassified Arthrobacter TaxID=235627 RepID=UPI00159E462B|nr:J domain-containing protein [Arthrobacter sp. STN4]MCQ9163076.1 DnaJ domain-containing protein [Arthrobacter sp. STN4]NVM97531.1 DnaJ domain-containing protein [Arthrobacter sp. SDTb3-6]
MSEKFLTHYQVLGVPSTATDREIKIAYRKAARLSHPDHGGDPALFRKVTAAYEVLGNPEQRLRYDRSYAPTARNGSAPGYGTGYGTAGRAAGQASGTGRPGGFPGTGFNGTFSTRRPQPARNTAGDPAAYVPAYESPDAGEVPILPRATAAQPVHGAPRKRGVFGAASRLAREARTAQLIMQQVLPGIPAARLINGLAAPANSGYIDHILVSGYRIAVIGSMLVPNGAFRWDGSMLVHGSKAAAPPLLVPASRRLQELFPECNVTAWVCVHSSTGNLFEPVIDYARGTEPDGSSTLNVANAARFVREVKHFLASGPLPNVVDLQVLGRLLGGMY